MSYCTADNIVARLESPAELVSLTDDANTGEADMDVVAAAIADADAEIDGYTGPRYGSPLDPVPEIIRLHACNIAIYRLYQRRQGATEERYRDYRTAIAFLSDIAKGKIDLPMPVPENTDRPGTAISWTRDQIFGTDFMKGY